MECVIKTSIEYEDLKRSSTLSSNILDAHCLTFQNEHHRMPRLDEIPGSNSSLYLTDVLKIKKNGGIKIQTLLDFTGAESLDEAIININNHFVDLLMSAVDVGEYAIIKTEQRPNNLVKSINLYFTPDERVSPLYLIGKLDLLRKLYGYDFKEVTNFDLESKEWKDLIPSNKLVKAFIYDGNIYINTDNMSVDSKVHEMLHLLVGSIRFTNPKLYSTLLEQATQIDNIKYLIETLHPDKTLNDALEEIFVSELSKQLTGLSSKLDTLSKEHLYEINYNIKRILDTLLMGDYSTNTISNKRLYTMSLKDVAKEVNSKSMTSTISKHSEIHRKLNQMKLNLLKNNELIEMCN